MENREEIFYNYDDSVKKWYLGALKNNAPIKTYKLNEVYIQRVSEWEDKLEKSITDFTQKEVEAMLRGFRFSSIASFHTIVSLIKRYIEFASNKLSKPMGAIQHIDMKKPEDFVNPTAMENKFLTREDLHTNLSKLDTKTNNYGDREDDLYKYRMGKAIAALLFEGLRGKAYSEITDLKVSDISRETKEIFISSKQTSIRIEDDRTWDLMDIYMNTIRRGTNKDDLVFLRKVREAGRPVNNEDNFSLVKMTDYNVKIYLKMVTESIGLPFLTGVPIYINGLAERVHEWLTMNNIPFTRANTIRYKDMYGERVGTNGLIETIENVYYDDGDQ